MIRRIWVMVLMVSLLAIPAARDARAGSPEMPRGEAMQEILARFEAYAEQARQDWGIPGMAIAIVQGDEMVYARGFGTKSMGGSDPVDENTLFQIGSTSKAFTSALMAQLVAEGKLKWTDKVVDYLPDFAMYEPWVTREFTIEDLMAQRSGMADHAAMNLYWFGYSRDDLARSSRYIKPVTSFRSAFAYQNILFNVAGAVIERVTDKSWDQNVAERIFDPLGMTASSSDTATFLAAANAVNLHQRRDAEVVPLAKDWPYHTGIDASGPAGGINSNVVDMAKWLRLHLNEGQFEGSQVVEGQALAYTHLPRTLMGDTLPWSYGLAWMFQPGLVPSAIIRHDGETLGGRAEVSLIPDKQVGIVVLSNMADQDLGAYLSYYFYDLYFSLPPADWSGLMLPVKNEELAQSRARMAATDARRVAAPARALSSYSGAYQNALYGQIEVSETSGSLEITIGPGKVKLELQPAGGDDFLVSLPQFSNYFGEAKFSMGPDGWAQGVVITRLAADGNGAFERLP